MTGSRPETSFNARAASRSRLMPGKTTTADLILKPELLFDPAQDEVAIEEFQGSALDGGEAIALGDDRRDHHIAFVIEGDGKGGDRRPVAHGDGIGPAASMHPADGDRPPTAQAVERGAEQFEIADAIELGVVGYPGRAIAEAELGAQIKVDLAAAIRGLALERASDPPLVERERPFDFCPD